MGEWGERERERGLKGGHLNIKAVGTERGCSGMWKQGQVGVTKNGSAHFCSKDRSALSMCVGVCLHSKNTNDARSKSRL